MKFFTIWLILVAMITFIGIMNNKRCTFDYGNFKYNDKVRVKDFAFYDNQTGYIKKPQEGYNPQGCSYAGFIVTLDTNAQDIWVPVQELERIK